MSEITLAEVKVAVNEAFSVWGPKIIEECKQQDIIMKANCEAHRIFNDKDNVKMFYRIEDKIDQHVAKHVEHEKKEKEHAAEKEAKFRWLIGILVTLFLSKTLWDFLKGIF